MANPASSVDWLTWATRHAAAGAAPEVLAVDACGARVVSFNAWRLGAEASPAPVVLKRQAPRTGPNAVRAMRALAAALPTDSPLAVPRVVAWETRRRVVAQARAEGEPVRPLLDSSRAPLVLAAVARALATLHATPVSVGRAVGVRDHVRDLMRPHPLVVAEHMPAFSDRIARVLSALDDLERHHGYRESRPLHRDAHARQMFYEDGRVWIVDWDHFARGDPALDVANFAVSLRTHLDAGATAAERFLSAYHALDSSVAPRVPLFTSLTYLRLACKAFRLRAPEWAARVSEHLRLAEDSLVQPPTV